MYSQEISFILIDMNIHILMQHLLHAGWLILRDTCLSGINSDQWVDDGQYTNESQQQSVLWRMIGMMTF